MRTLNPLYLLLSDLEDAVEHDDDLLSFLDNTFFFRTLLFVSLNILSKTCRIVECFLSKGLGYIFNCKKNECALRLADRAVVRFVKLYTLQR